jgi:hypothetical protein
VEVEVVDEEVLVEAVLVSEESEVVLDRFLVVDVVVVFAFGADGVTVNLRRWSG